MSYVYRSPEEMASAFADKFEDEFSDILDDVAVRQECVCEDLQHGSTVTTYRELIAGLRTLASDPEQTDSSFFQIFLQLAAPIMNDAMESERDPLDVLAEQTLRDESP